MEGGVESESKIICQGTTWIGNIVISHALLFAIKKNVSENERSTIISINGRSSN
jgi:hypothetical protein